MKPDIDLSKLAFDNNASTKEASKLSLPKRNKLTKVVIPGILITGFLIVCLWAARGFLIPAVAVTVTPVITSSAGSVASNQTTSTPLFQAPGWIEPAPLPTQISALTSGVVSEVLVLDGDKVERNQIVAKLFDQDAKLLVAEARANLEQRRAEYEAAEKTLQNPIDQKEAVERSQAEERRLKAELFELKQKLQLAKKLLGNKNRMAEIGALSTNQQRQAEMDVIEIETNIAKLEAQQSANQASIEAAQSRLTLRLEDRQRLDITRAAVKEAEIQLKRTQLQLERCLIRAPIDGVVMRVMVTPGSVVTAFNEIGGNSIAIMSLYSPEELQARVDVPMAEASKIQLDMPVEVRLEAIADRAFRAQVIRIAGQADLQRNTLPVKVKLLDVDPKLKPDMLARVQFFSPQESSNTTTIQSSAALFVAEEAIENKDGQTAVWVVDAITNLAKRRVVRLGSRKQGDLREVVSGLAIGEKVVRQNREKLTEGARVHIQGVE